MNTIVFYAMCVLLVACAAWYIYLRSCPRTLLFTLKASHKGQPVVHVAWPTSCPETARIFGSCDRAQAHTAAVIRGLLRGGCCVQPVYWVVPARDGYFGAQTAAHDLAQLALVAHPGRLREQQLQPVCIVLVTHSLMPAGSTSATTQPVSLLHEYEDSAEALNMNLVVVYPAAYLAAVKSDSVLVEEGEIGQDAVVDALQAVERPGTYGPQPRGLAVLRSLVADSGLVTRYKIYRLDRIRFVACLPS